MPPSLPRGSGPGHRIKVEIHAPRATGLPHLRDWIVSSAMKILCLTIFLLAHATALRGASFHDDFAVVFIDAASEAKLGQFPLNRSVLAKGIRQAGNLGA